MKRILTIFSMVILTSLATVAQEARQTFSPEKFQAELEQFITNEACLTPQEATRFFPLYREMQKRQRSVFNQMKMLGKIKPTDETECRKAIQKRDELELEQKSILQTYHNKFLGVLSASKVYDVIKAEDKFHRRKFRDWGRQKPPRSNSKEHQK